MPNTTPCLHWNEETNFKSVNKRFIISTIILTFFIPENRLSRFLFLQNAPLILRLEHLYCLSSDAGRDKYLRCATRLSQLSDIARSLSASNLSFTNLIKKLQRGRQMESKPCSTFSSIEKQKWEQIAAEYQQVVFESKHGSSGYFVECHAALGTRPRQGRNQPSGGLSLICELSG